MESFCLKRQRDCDLWDLQQFRVLIISIFHLTQIGPMVRFCTSSSLQRFKRSHVTMSESASANSWRAICHRLPSTQALTAALHDTKLPKRLKLKHLAYHRSCQWQIHLESPEKLSLHAVSLSLWKFFFPECPWAFPSGIAKSLRSGDGTSDSPLSGGKLQVSVSITPSNYWQTMGACQEAWKGGDGSATLQLSSISQASERFFSSCR